MVEEWRIHAKRGDFNGIGKEFNIDPVVARIIRNRDWVEKEQIQKYLYGTLEEMYESSLIKDLNKGCEIIIQKISQGQSIRIISDYDVDGVMSNYILLDGLESLGANVSYEIPDRMLDGYGINERIIRQAKKDGVDTIITCDNGIAAVDAIGLAKELGMTVVVTDHHEVPYEVNGNGQKEYKLVPADAVIDIKRVDCDYPFKELCGAAVAYKFIVNLYKMMGKQMAEKDLYMEFLAMATLCDVMDLRDENRIFVKAGMKKMFKTKNIGLQCLLEATGLKGRPITSTTLGFVLGPCINATGRLESAKRGLELLISKDVEQARILAEELVSLNEQRKEKTNDGMMEAFNIVDNTQVGEDKVLVIYLPDMHESIAGIVAGRVREKYYKPVFVITNSENNMLKGSGRSIEGYNMFEALNQCKTLLSKFGGHELAAGLSLTKDKLETLRNKLNEQCTLTQEELTPKIFIDVPMPINYIHMDLVQQLKLLEPFGKGNPKPVFAISGIRVESLKIFGKNKNVAAINFRDENGYKMKGINFDATTLLERIKGWFSCEECDKILSGKTNNVVLDIIYYPDINEYGGMRSLQLLVANYRKHQD